MNEKKQVHILYTKISARLPEELYKKYLIYLPDSMRDQHFRFKRWQDRTANLFSRILLIKGFEKYGLDYNSLENLHYNPYGRPGLPGQVDFNISHSGEYIVCAIGKEVRVGIDIEEIKPVDFSDFENLMTTEQWMIIRNSNNPLKSFFTFWAIKESIIKADGRGLSVPLNEILISQNKAHYEQTWYLKELDVNENYCANLASNQENPSIILEYIDLSNPQHPSN